MTTVCRPAAAHRPAEISVRTSKRVIPTARRSRRWTTPPWRLARSAATSARRRRLSAAEGCNGMAPQWSKLATCRSTACGQPIEAPGLWTSPTLPVAQRGRPPVCGETSGISHVRPHRQPLRTHSRSERPSAASRSTSALTCCARARGTTRTASGVSTTTRSSTPTTATSRPDWAATTAVESTATTSVAVPRTRIPSSSPEPSSSARERVEVADVVPGEPAPV